YEHVASMRKDEIIVSLNKNKLVVNKAELTRRIRDHIFWFHNGEIILDTQNIYKGELKLQKEDVSESTSILKGQNASVNVNINGIVKILHTPKEMSKLKEGEILVTSMTNPEFLPAMQRAAGFITEDGGLLSHAAIVARELKIPCIIGTKYATQVLKDGMEVEVDADKGVVKILK
ncbi:MAG: PEP-utilizing enzyme, partial [Candidatus Nanoarchaeia archaeon]